MSTAPPDTQAGKPENGLRALESLKLDAIPSQFVSLWLPDSLEHSCDVSILVQGERYGAHECIISAASSVLKVMLTNGMRESVTKEITLTTIKKAPWELVLEFMYTGCIAFESEQVAIEVAHFAHQYAMNLLLMLAANKLVQYTCKENAIDRLLIADALGLHTLRKEAMDLIRSYFLTIYETVEFKNLPFRIVDEILGSKELALLSELDIFEAVTGWLNYTHPSDDERWSPIHANGIISPWKNAEARHLVQYMDVKSMGIDEIKTLGKLPAVNSYPDILPKLLTDISSYLKNVTFITHRYEPRLKAKRFTFLFKVKPKDIVSGVLTNSPWHINAMNETKYRLQIARNYGNTYTANIEPMPENSKNSEVFILGQNRKNKSGFQIRTVDKIVPFSNHNPNMHQDITFGVNIFY